ncbi:Outer membrane protein assembly factor yaeT [Desulfovibrio sp. X2]|uniref:outer membrane protein assembly factor BamA n=1 Tax=Desulfovibrio sp. X2 TaxID=941449 RepID=UPI000358911F|nr:outer membrane protein assembly factor BamA [Desulfovibrio sp. X2]EPR37475.1 Outer membrane protein assembly factor yaeT [Desulfovibrio sp. X2]
MPTLPARSNPARALLLAFSLLAASFAPSTLCAQPSALGSAPGVDAPRLLILPFAVNAGPDLAYMRDSLPKLLSDKLKEQGFEVVSQDETANLVKSKGATTFDDKTIRELTLLAKAQDAVYGTFSQIGDTLNLDLRIVDGFGAKPDQTVSVTKKGLINVLPAVEEAAQHVRMALMHKDVIAEVTVEGLKYLDPDVVLMRVKMQKGDIYDPQTANNDLREVFNLGYFDDVKIEVQDEPEGKKVIFKVQEKPRIAAISVQGTDAVSDSDILEVMGTKTGSVLNLKILSDDLNKIRALYKSKGYYLAEVTYHLDESQKGTARLVLDVKEGQKLYIRKITIKGAHQLDEDDLKGELALSERGMFSWITGSGILKEEMLDRDAAVLEAYYANRGFIDAKVAPPTVEYKEDGIYITFTVEEGDRYKVGTVNIEGDLIEPKEKLLEHTKLDDLAKDDDYFDRSVLRDDLHRLNEFYANFGYAFAKTEVQSEVDRDAKRINITYEIQKEQKVYIRRVLVEGNSKTRENVIRREMLLGDGDKFSGQKLSRSSERLNKLGYFKTVDIETVPTGDPALMDLKVKVEEKPTGSVSAGVGYSSVDQFFVGATVQEKNLFGRGYTLAVSGTLGGVSQNSTVTFINPSVNDTKWSWSNSIYLRKYNWDDYEQSTIGGRTGVSYPIGEYTRVSAGYSLERFDIYDIDDDSAALLKEFKGVNWSSTVDVGATRDTTDDNFMPTKGTVNKVNMYYDGGPLGGTTSFVKYVYSSHWFTKLFAGTIFHVHGQIGYVGENVNGDDVPPWERFYLGGIDTVRGYSGNKISPRDAASDDRIGGNKELFFNVEYFFPIAKELNIWGLTFFDMGNAWDDGQSFFYDTKQEGGSNLPLGMYKSVGLGMRWNSPFGPLRIEYGYPLDKLSHSSSTGRIEFKIGGAF